VRMTAQSLRVPACCTLAVLVFLLTPTSLASKDTQKDGWRQLAIYELMVDRFNDPASGTCMDSSGYCGGTFQGIQDQVDYISDMNFPAVWITPITEQEPKGYHGYWPSDLYKLNPLFGTDDQAAAAFTSLRSAGISVMLDIVMNHMGYGQTYPSYQYYYNPFNQASHFHNCTVCGPECSTPDITFSTQAMTPELYEQMWTCQLSNLPDLDHEVPFVKQQYFEWISYLTQRLPLDGLRIDAAAFMHPEFLREFSQHSELFALGEIFVAPGSNASYEIIQKYVEAGNATNGRGADPLLFSQLDYPFCAAARLCFAGADAALGMPATLGCAQISAVRSTYAQMDADQTVMGRFVESADIPRFLSMYNNLPALRNALMLVFFSEGIPIFYYGTEQGLGADTPPGFEEREPLWPTGFSRAGPLFAFVRGLNWYRFWTQLWTLPMTELYVGMNDYVFSRGDAIIVALTNGNSSVTQYELTGLSPNKLFCAGLAAQKVRTIRDAYVWISAQCPPLFGTISGPVSS